MKMYDQASSPGLIKTACKCLHLHPKACQLLSSDRLICLVTEDWIKNLYRGFIPPHIESDFDDCTWERLLSRSCQKIPQPWRKISIKTFEKFNGTYKGLSAEHPEKQWSCGSLYEFMSHICKENTSNLWAQAHKVLKVKPHHHWQEEEVISFTSLVKQVLRKLQPAVYLSLQPLVQDDTILDALPSACELVEVQSETTNTAHSRPGSFYTTENMVSNHGFLQCHAVVETEQHFFIIQPYFPYTLKDVVTFSPSLLESSHAKPLFVIYQLLQAMQSLHNFGLGLGNATISNILLDENMWLRVSVPRKSTFKAHHYLPVDSEPDSSESNADSSSNSVGKDSAVLPTVLSSICPLQQLLGSPSNINEKLFQIACEFLKKEQYRSFEISMIDNVVSAWVHRSITNFQYLMILNHLAGRRMGDPNNHPVLPWVLDFSAPDSGYRDLSKSKFRLNKGDGQLDFTFTGMQLIDDAGEHVPHHISDILSDITYYVYKARRTPKSVLCAHVRSNWVPHEYPHSMQRMQLWTPDECIPEFFTDPSIFESIHDDLPDLATPRWSKNTVDFVVRHLAALESDHVSSNLHRWIDLTFGHKLSGSAAIKAKNVHLHLVDQHTHLVSYGASQLFLHPHPQRDSQLSPTAHKVPRIIRGVVQAQLSSFGFPDNDSELSYGLDISRDGSDPSKISQAAIYLPKTFNPMADLERCEKMLQFNAKALHVTSSVTTPSVTALETTDHQDGVTQDMVTFLCLVCEIFLDDKLRMQDSKPSLQHRIKTIKKICSSEFTEIQRPLKKFVSDMFACLEMGSNKTFTFSTIFPDGSPMPTPSFLLQTYSDFISFPQYFSDLFSCLDSIEGKSLQIESLHWSRIPAVEKVNKIKQLEREKVPLLESFLWRHQGYLGVEGMGLVLPYIKNLLHNHYTMVHAAWALFNVAARELGQVESTKQFLSELTPLFTGEGTTAKHIKLYHRSFLMQLIIRLGLKTFLDNFSTLLVEAVAGYKDFPLSSKFYHEELLEDLSQQDFLQSSGSESVQMTWDYTNDDVDVVDGRQENTDFNEDKESDNDSEQMDDTIVDRMSLNGEHVLLENDETELARDSSLKDLDEDSLSGVSSDDDTEHGALQQRRLLLQEEEMTGDKSGSADRHSIHSISMLIPTENRDTGNGFTEGSGDSEMIGFVSNEGSADHSRKSSTVKEAEKHDVLTEDDENEERDTIEETDLERDDVDETDSSSVIRNSRDKSDMVRSETEDLMMNLSADNPGGAINIRDIAADSVKWLTHKLGPVLATKYLSRNLVRMLALCYLGVEQLQLLENLEESDIKTSQLVVGDKNAQKILECMAFTVVLYGEQVILIQCLPNIMDLITMGEKRLTVRSESGLIASVILLSFLLPYMSDTSLMNVFEDHVINGCINPVMSIIESTTICFPSGALSRFVLCHKFIDLLYKLGLRLGFEMTRKYLNGVMLRLFDVFSTVHGEPNNKQLSTSLESSVLDVGSCGSDDTYLDIKIDALTQQYKIGSPVDLRLIKSPKDKLRKIHSLSYIAVNDDKDDYVDSKTNNSNAEKCMQELKSVFTPELAQACYIPLCRIFGSIHMEENLSNDDLIRQLCAQHDTEMDAKYPNGQQSKQNSDKRHKETFGQEDDLMTPVEEGKVLGAIGSNIAVVGNRIQLNEAPVSPVPVATQELGQFGRGYRHSGILSMRVEELRSAEMDQNKGRHLSGNWLAYWERELGRHERDTMFNFLQIELQTYIGHTSSIRSLCCMDSENCFISASKDKTVRLWSVSSCGDGMKKIPSLYCYSRHKKSVFSVAYVDSMRQVASCDSTVHVWDPYTGMAVSQLESPKYAPVVALTALPSPSTLVAMATTENTLRFLEMRTSKYTHSFKASLGNCGLMRCVVVSPDSSWIAVGFTSGFIFILDVRSGILLHHWKAHDAEILQLKAYSKSRILSSAFDQTIKLWNVDTGQEVCLCKSQTEPVHCLSLYRDQLISATTANRVSVYASVTDTTAFSSSKLKTGTFKGVLTHMCVLPLNKALLLGADNGTIRLMA